MNKKAFTLIELIGVIVIIGLILMIVFPSFGKLMHGNDLKKYENYYSILDAGAKAYAKTHKDQIGNSNQSGCVEFTLDDLEKEGYVNKYSDKTTSCSLSSSIIRVKNLKGKLKVYLKLSCESDRKAGDIKTLGTEDTGACIAYAQTERSTLYESFRTLPSATWEAVDGVSYLSNNASNNYLYYSGMLWKIFAHNSMEETVRAISYDSLTTIPYSVKATNDYLDSTVQKWLASEVSNNFRNQDRYLSLTNYDPTTDKNTEQFITAKIGLMNYVEANNSPYAIVDSNHNFWLMTRGTESSQLMYISTAINLVPGVNNILASNFASVKPVISFSPEIDVISGTGTINDPFIIEEDYYGAADELLNTRTTGEHVYLKINGNDKKYRINRLNDDGTVRLISNDLVGPIKFDNAFYDYSATNLRTYLESNIYNTLDSASKALLVNSSVCTEKLNPDFFSEHQPVLNSSCLNKAKEKVYPIGIPKLGELYATTQSTGSIWTSNSYFETASSDNSSMNVIASKSEVKDNTVSSLNFVQSILTLKEDVKIASGKGTASDPYRLK